MPIKTPRPIDGGVLTWIDGDVIVPINAKIQVQSRLCSRYGGKTGRRGRFRQGKVMAIAKVET